MSFCKPIFGGATKLMRFAAFVCTTSAICGIGACVQNQPKGDAAKPSARMSYPEVPTFAESQDAWKKLVDLISSQGGYISAKSFERTFKVALVRTPSNEPTLKNDTFYVTHQGKNWILDSSLIIKRIADNKGDRVVSGLIVTFKDLYYPNANAGAKNPCIPASSAIAALEAHGWHLAVPLSQSPNFQLFRSFSRPASDYHVTLGFAYQCVWNIAVSNNDFMANWHYR
ncbi:MAG: hypothetical protein V4567_06055 [Pseudomonadota bacterium]